MASGALHKVRVHAVISLVEELTGGQLEARRRGRLHGRRLRVNGRPCLGGLPRAAGPGPGAGIEPLDLADVL
eukprot:9985308-Lingulodinium_polyedra.AAC.1